jgi:acetyltransferase-like isoleucine patch superfamily enzyme
MKRDFSTEAIINILLRGYRSVGGRVRGRIYYLLRLFASGSSHSLYFGCGARFVNSKSIRLGADVHFGINSRLECYGPVNDRQTVKIEIGSGTSFGDNFHAGSINRITIGRNVLGASGILIVDHNHGDPRTDLANTSLSDPKSRPLVSRGPIVVGDDVWLGEGVILLGGACIGEGAVVGARAIVRGHVPPRTVYSGNAK